MTVRKAQMAAGVALDVADLQCSDANCYDPTPLAIDVAAAALAAPTARI